MFEQLDQNGYVDPDELQRRGVALLRSKDDKALNVEFYTRTVKNHTETKKQKKPVFKEKVYVKIARPGSKNVIDRPAHDGDKRRFPREFYTFERASGGYDDTEGWSIREWAALKRADAEMLLAHEIKTVEQLAALDDASCRALGPGIITWRGKAKAALEQATSTGGAENQAAEIERLEKQLEFEKKKAADREAKYEERLKMIEQGLARKADRRGRKPKAAEETVNGANDS